MVSLDLTFHLFVLCATTPGWSLYIRLSFTVTIDLLDLIDNLLQSDV